ncbi:glutamate--tRNA ligase [Patescibacteria group bacterium]
MKETNKKIVTRFAPSPTGMMHVGSLRTALYNYLWAKHNQGKFILRIEDTDQERLVEGAVTQIIKTLDWAGLEYDEGSILGEQEKGDHGPYIQSKRLDIYRQHVDKLLKSGAAYRCFCTREEVEKMREQQQARGVPTMYDRRCLKLTEQQVREKLDAGDSFVVRLKIPRDGVTAFKDVVRKRVQFENKLIDDQVLLKSDGFPTYHLAVVVDDYLMGVNYVIRGEEWLPSTPKHILLYLAFGWKPPKYAHLPLLVDKQKRKLSKRHGDVSVDDFIKKGYLKEAIINFVALLGWNPKSTEEIFTLSGLVEKFALQDVHKAAAVFDTDKLDWINGKYIRDMTPLEVLDKAEHYLSSVPGYDKMKTDKDFICAAIKLEQPRIKRFDELPDAIGFFFADELEYDPQGLIWRKSDQAKTIAALEQAINKLESFSEANWQQDSLEKQMLAFAKESDIDNGTMFWPIRFALSGKDRSPSPFEIMQVLGKEKSLNRIKAGLALLSK